MSGATSVIEPSSTNTKFPSGEDSNSNGKLSDKDHEAIRLFEKAIDKEALGMMSDAVSFYRRAFRINEQVDILYRTQKVPHTINKLREEGGKNIAKRIDEEKVKKINVDELIESFIHTEAIAIDPNNPDQDDPNHLTIKLVNLGLETETIADIKPVSPLIHLPNEIWHNIMEILLLTSPESWFKFSITCKRNAYLGLGSSNIWRKLCYLVYSNQIYEENVLYLNARSVKTLDDDDSLPVPKDLVKILPQYNNSWKYMFHTRPFIKFLGCYISVVNYYGEGGKAEFSSSWSNPVRTITYYRYIRFYPDGSCVKVLSAMEPSKVVPHLSKYNVSNSIVGFVSDPSTTESSTQSQTQTQSQSQTSTSRSHTQQIKESQRIYHGKWTISTNGEIHIIIDNGSVPYYTFHYNFNIKTLGGIFKHNKLTWGRYYAIRKKMSEDDDRQGEETEFSLKNEKPFKFSRVKSYRIDN
ncbi:uncharacterized protein RJT21DRAFT_119666 [Scheffersomyces amazonensis]|uniref:uncharacterized protein n=1 Tax=Scheffersomyces amazonensis TaxID=1078765 RepID=UPI00315DE51B